MDLNEALNASVATSGTEAFCEINDLTREINIPEELKVFGVENDKKSNVRKFRCPRFVGKGIDLMQHQIRFNYSNAKGGEEGKGKDIAVNVVDDGYYVMFDWEISKNATFYKGTVKFIVCAVTVDEEGNVETEWNTTLAEGVVKEGLEVGNPEPEKSEKDIIAQLLQVTKKTSDDAIAAVEAAKNVAIQEFKTYVSTALLGGES